MTTAHAELSDMLMNEAMWDDGAESAATGLMAAGWHRFETFEPGTNPDCARDIHQGTTQPAVAELLVDGVPLCLHHARADMPVVTG